MKNLNIYENPEVDFVVKSLEENKIVYRIATIWCGDNVDGKSYKAMTYRHRFSEKDLHYWETTEQLLEASKAFVEDFNTAKEAIEYAAVDFGIILDLSKQLLEKPVVNSYSEALVYLESEKINSFVFIGKTEELVLERTHSIEAVIAMSKSGIIGNSKTNKMPWDLPSELKHFKELTMGHKVYMGSNTERSIGRLLPGRENNVISSKLALYGHGMPLDFAKAKMYYQPGKHFVIGGAEIYKQMAPYINLWHVSYIEDQLVGEGDITFELPHNLIEVYREKKDGFDYVILEKQ